MNHLAPSRLDRRSWLCVVRTTRLLLCAGVAGCAESPTALTVGEWVQPTVVLTFDDGPLPADQPLQALSGSADELLDPLRSILATLERNDARAVFFIEGPGYEGLDDEGAAAFAAGLREIHAAGHTLGYHAFAQDPAIWTRPSLFPPLAAAPMAADLRRLVLFLEDATHQAGLTLDNFAPVFRQPFGGLGISRLPAVFAAAERDWTYRGYRIDSADWVLHADSPSFVVERFGALDEAERVEFVAEQLRHGVRRIAGRATAIDVLFHVSEFTAANLQTWLDALRDETEAVFGAAPTFEVPARYLGRCDLFVDLSIARELLSAARP